MPASVRIIRVIDDTYTVETEVEADDIKSLMQELQSSQWGLKIAAVLENMLPDVKAKITISQARERFINDWKDEIDSQGIAKVDLGENDDGDEILIVWINRPVESIPKILEGYKIEVKKTPSYVEPRPEPTEYSDP